MAAKSPTRKRPAMAAGQRYGRLIAVRFAGYIPRPEGGKGRQLWRFNCDCGQEPTFRVDRVRSGEPQSCGCLHQEAISARHRASVTHGLSTSPEYKCWNNMLTRCLNPKSKNYPRYGGRGIKVRKRWLKFANFYADMGPRPSQKHSIERIRNEGDYKPDNCCWALPVVQQRNKRSNRFVVVGGRRMTIAEACERAGIDHALVRDRLRNGWSIERSLSP